MKDDNTLTWISISTNRVQVINEMNRKNSNKYRANREPEYEQTPKLS